MGKIITVINQKGGVAKTTTVHTIANAWAQKKKKVLLIDLDAQCNLTLLNNKKIIEEKSIYHALMEESSSLESYITHEDGALPMVGSSQLVASIQQIPYDLLSKLLKSVIKSYDYIVIDTPPSLNIITLNALYAADAILVPAQADLFSIQGLSQLADTLKELSEFTKKQLGITGIILTRYTNRIKASNMLADEFDQQAKLLGTKVFKSRIRECAAVREACLMLKDIFSYAPRSNATIDYKNLVREIDKELK